MKKLSKLLLFILLVVVIGFSGLLAGRHVSNMMQPKTPEEIALQEQQRSEKKALKERKRQEKEFQKKLAQHKVDYQASPSSFGPFLKIQKIDVVYGDDEAIALIGKDGADNIQAEQEVILYDTDGNVMPLGGTVTYINNQDGKRKIAIQLPEGTNTEFLSNEVGVITEETTVSQRIPLTSLTKNSEGENIIWIATETGENQFTFSKKRVEKERENETFFVPVGLGIGPYDLIVTNPDKFIQPDKEYSLSIKQIIEPVLNPIDQAKIDFDQYIFKKRQEELHQIAQDCVNRTRTADTGDGISLGSSSSCGGTADENDIMFEVFRSLTKPPE